MSSEVEVISDSSCDTSPDTPDESAENLKNELDETNKKQEEVEKRLADELARSSELESRLNVAKNRIAELENKIILDQSINQTKLKSLQSSLNDICERIKISDESVYKASINQQLNEDRLKALENMLKVKDQALLAAESALVSAQNKLAYSMNYLQPEDPGVVKKLTRRVDFYKAQIKTIVEQLNEDRDKSRWVLECVEAENRIRELEAALRQETWSKAESNTKISEISQELLDVKSDFSRRESVMLNNEKIAKERYDSHMEHCSKEKERLNSELGKLRAKLEFAESKLNVSEKQAEFYTAQLKELQETLASRNEVEVDGDIVEVLTKNVEGVLNRALKDFGSDLDKKISVKVKHESSGGVQNAKSVPPRESEQGQAQISAELLKKLAVRCQAAEERVKELERADANSKELFKKLVVRCQAAEGRLKELEQRPKRTNRYQCFCSHLRLRNKLGIGWAIAKHSNILESLAILNIKLKMQKSGKSLIVPPDIAKGLYVVAKTMYTKG